MWNVASTPHVEASLVVGANMFIAPTRGAPPLVDKIKLAQENISCASSCDRVPEASVSKLSLDRLLNFSRSSS